MCLQTEQSVGKRQAEASEGARELRSGALGVIASVLRRFPAAADYSALWPRFFVAAAPLMPRLVAEVGIRAPSSALRMDGGTASVLQQRRISPRRDLASCATAAASGGWAGELRVRC